LSIGRLRASAGILSLLLGAHRAAAQRIPLVLNHVSITLDSATYHDVASSPFLSREFASVAHATAISFIGKYSWLEVRQANPAHPVSVILSTERANQFDALLARWGLKATTLTFTDADKPAPLFVSHCSRNRALAPDAALPLVESVGPVVICGYSDAEVASMAVLDSLDASDLSLRRFLQPYYDSTKFLARVSGATIAVRPADIQVIVNLLRQDSVQVTMEGEGAKIAFSGFDLHLVPPYAGSGIRQLRFALNDEHPSNAVYRFGPRSQLRFGPGATAVWDF
jgi:Family of unknown function (DUF5829)